jgi:glycosyltransferase involved in cell wall biosynthesis
MMRTMVVALLTLGDPARLTGGYLYHRRMAELAARQGARLHFASFPERPFPLAALAAPRVLRQARALGAQALVLDSIAAAFLAPWLVGRSTVLPLVGMLHQQPGGIDFGPLRTALQARLDRQAYRRAAHLMVASASLAEQLAEQGWPAELLTVVAPGRDVAASVEPPAADLRRGRQAAFLCVGNWVERKGLHDLLEAFAGLPAAAGTLHLVGDDRAEPRYAARLRQRLAQPDLAARVIVHGPRSREQVAGFYAAADVFVLPSRREPYGTVYGEAMTFDLPVVGWRAGNLPHLAEHEREGLILEVGDLAGLRQALARLAGDEPLRRRLGAAAGRKALGWPTWEESAALFFGTIRAVAERAPRSL